MRRIHSKPVIDETHDGGIVQHCARLYSLFFQLFVVFVAPLRLALISYDDF